MLSEVGVELGWVVTTCVSPLGAVEMVVAAESVLVLVLSLLLVVVVDDDDLESEYVGTSSFSPVV